jgi:hypothetical protein
MNTSPESLDIERLPELTDERIDDIERALFGDIAADRTKRRARRGRVWLVAGAAAAVLVLAAVISPGVTGLISPSGFSGADGSAVSPEMGGDGAVVDRADGGGSAVEEGAGPTDYSSTDDGATAGRDIITTASATLLVDDAAAAANEIADAAVDSGGYVESMSIDGTDAQRFAEDGVAYDAMPYPVSNSWITVRVPADELQPLIASLDDIGEVTTSQISRQDVTEQTVDLQARIEAAQASVDRLTQLMAGATSTADLLAAESALAERQATLEAYQSELESLEGMVALSSLTVSLTEPAETVEADPAGFADGLAAGWNGLVATLNGIVIGLGFLIPWIAVAAVAWLVVWAIVRVIRRRRTRSTPEPTRPTSSDASSE